MEEDKTMGKTEEDDSGEEKKEELAVGQDGCSYSYQQLQEEWVRRLNERRPTVTAANCAAAHLSAPALPFCSRLTASLRSGGRRTTGAEAGDQRKVA